MDDFIRLFYGVRFGRAGDVPDTGPLAGLLRQLDNFDPTIKPVRRNGLHITLKFLGDTTINLVDELSTRLQKITRVEAPFEVRLIGLGVFPNERRPAVLWVGMQNAEPLHRLAAQLEDIAAEFNVAREFRIFRPHLTVARIQVKPPQRLFDLLAANTNTDFGSFTINQVELIQSNLLPNGVEYKSMAVGNFSAKR